MAGLKEARAKARAQAQLRPVQDRIAHTEALLGPFQHEDGGTECRRFQNPRSHGGR